MPDQPTMSGSHTQDFLGRQLAQTMRDLGLVELQDQVASRLALGRKVAGASKAPPRVRKAPLGAPTAVRPGKLPQACARPGHVDAPSAADVKRAAEVARVSCQQANPDELKRVVAYFAPWVRPWFRRCVQSQEQCTRELAAVPKWLASKLGRCSEPFGGRRTSAGRHVIAYGCLLYWHARAGLNVISGLSRAAWASLSVGTRPLVGEAWTQASPADRSRRSHYAIETLFHRLHDADGPVDPEARGPQGGRVGAGSNCGLVAVLEREGLIATLQPDGRAELPSWLVGPSGYAFVQVLVLIPRSECLGDPPEPLPAGIVPSLVPY